LFNYNSSLSLLVIDPQFLSVLLRWPPAFPPQTVYLVKNLKKCRFFSHLKNLSSVKFPSWVLLVDIGLVLLFRSPFFPHVCWSQRSFKTTSLFFGFFLGRFGDHRCEFMDKRLLLTSWRTSFGTRRGPRNNFIAWRFPFPCFSIRSIPWCWSFFYLFLFFFPG